MSSGIEDRVHLDFVRYANVWEDANILCDALEPAPGKRIVSIASGGDNAFALLEAGAEVVAADLSQAQLACVELKLAAIRQLDHPATLAFLGIRPATDRPATYAALAGELTSPARAHWEAHPDDIAAGIAHCGKFENYFRLFRTRVLPLVHSRRRVAALLAPKSADERREFYRRHWNTWRWRLLFKLFFSRWAMGRLGRDPEFFRYVEGSVGDRILARASHALVELPADANPYLDYILNGNYTRALPRYLEPQRYEALRAGLDRLTLHQGPIQEAASTHRGDGVDGYNLSDIFEYLDPATCEQVYGELLAAARPGARLAYWNMLAPRSCPPAFANRVTSLADLSRDLFARDQAMFYSAFVVEELR